MTTSAAKGLFITFEGPEGSGKSTHIRRLADWLREQGRDVLATREPGGSGLGEELRRLIKHYEGPDPVCDEAELLLFGACRAQLMRRVVLPHLAKDGVVLCDRFADSTTVYQGFGRGLDMSFIERMHLFSIGGRWPDLTFLLDVDLRTSYARMEERTGVPGDRIEAAGQEFHRQVREGFLALARLHPHRFRVLNTERPPAEVAADIRREVEACLAKRSAGGIPCR